MFGPHFKRLLQTATLWSLLATGLRMGGLLLILPLILRKVSPEELGLWYIFQALGFLGVFLDLGFGSTLVRAMSFLWAGAPKLVGSGFHSAASLEPNFLEIRRFVATMRYYYRYGAIIFLCLAESLGTWWIYGQTAGMESQSEMVAAWIFYALGMALSFYGNLWPSLLQGVNGVTQAQKIFFAGLLCNYGTVAVGLCLNWGIWALAAGNILQGTVARIAGKKWFLLLAGKEVESSKTPWDFEILKVLWPMAWRGGGTAIGGYLILNANILICGRVLGLGFTASYGVTLQLILALTGICGIWLNVKIPLINQMRIRNEVETMRRIFDARLALAVLTFICGGVVLILMGPMVLMFIGSKSSLLPTDMMAVLVVLFFLEMHASQHSTLILTENLNPFLWPALISGVAICVFSLILSPKLGAWGMIFSYGFVQMAFNYWYPVAYNLKRWRLGPKAYFRSILFLDKFSLK